MKKIVVLLLSIFILTGCNNTLSLDFKDEINANIKFSFTLEDYKKYSGSDELDIDAIISEIRPIDNVYDELFKEKQLHKKDNSYEGEFEYTYTYDNFKENMIFKRCIENPVVIEEDDKYLVYLSGKSNCGEFSLNVKANNRMLENNSSNHDDGIYKWNVNEKNNDIRFNISKNEIKSGGLKAMDFIYIVLAIIMIIVVILLKKRLKNKYN